VDGSIGETRFDARVELPPPRDLPTQAEVDELHRRFEDALAYLPAGEQNVLRTRWAVTFMAFTAARERGDTAQAVHEFEELERLVPDNPGPVQLQPAKYEFDALVQEVSELIAQLRRHGPAAGKSFDGDETARALDAYRLSGEDAYRDGKQAPYGEAVLSLQRLRDYLEGLPTPPVPPGSVDPGEQAYRLVLAVRYKAERLLTTARALGDRGAEGELSEIREQAAQLAPRATTDPHTTIEACGRLIARLEAIEASLPLRPGTEPGDSVPLK
jgi:hypothetical protein